MNTSTFSSPVEPASSSPRCVALCPRAGRGAAVVLPSELRDLLAQRNAAVECFDNALAALAALMVHERGFANGAHRDPMLLILVEPSKLRDTEMLVAAAAKYAHHAAVWQYDPASERRLARYTAPIGVPASANGGPSAMPGPADAQANGSGPAALRRPVLSPPRPALSASGGSFVSWGGMPGSGGVVMMSGAPRAAAPSNGPKLRLTPIAASSEPAGESGAGASNGVAPPHAPRSAVVRPELSEEEIAMLLDPSGLPAGPAAGPNGASGGNGTANAAPRAPRSNP
ncbi:MAG: hypothetical protein ACKVZJ_03805 [Phycisphaerales bacterium]